MENVVEEENCNEDHIRENLDRLQKLTEVAFELTVQQRETFGDFGHSRAVITDAKKAPVNGQNGP
jgi:hypothetical protein